MQLVEQFNEPTSRRRLLRQCAGRSASRAQCRRRRRVPTRPQGPRNRRSRKTVISTPRT